ncbi:uncharacterized protein CIMG_11319 [Coccidioides immitis RS]|uniref:Extracellular membrane protein CFEM domain-containing protein n=1 Tax=Coccidioides immitis (strain RS) TaxID=246410 RepID=A0A0D8JUK9_COCIM|nr:uncharacterized protein CIMG_11319 [Coccidioides immitis RS]KJF60982.1 hypothetical protein CIMG_11319 [Coccidioides immitis RS]
MKFVSAFIATIIAARTLGLDIPECATRCFEVAESNLGCNVPIQYSCLCVLSPVSNDFHHLNVETHQMTRKVRHFWDNKSFFGVFVKISILWAGMAKKNQSRIAAVHPHAAKQRRTWPKVVSNAFVFAFCCLSMSLVAVMVWSLIRFWRTVLNIRPRNQAATANPNYVGKRAVQREDIEGLSDLGCHREGFAQVISHQHADVSLQKTVSKAFALASTAGPVTTRLCKITSNQNWLGQGHWPGTKGDASIFACSQSTMTLAGGFDWNIKYR